MKVLKDNYFIQSFFQKIFGKFDASFYMGPSDIDSNFRDRYKNILSKVKGGGYWLWKPYILNKITSEAAEGDYIFYSDAGAIILHSIKKFVQNFENETQDIFCFELPLIEKQWSKRELFKNLDACSEIINTNQIGGSQILIRKSKESQKFLKEYLDECCKEENIFDSAEQNISESFISHRYDQSILSILYKKHGLIPFKDPSQYGIFPQGYAGCPDKIHGRDKIQLLSSGRLFLAKNYKKNYNDKLFIIHSRNENRLSCLLNSK